MGTRSSTSRLHSMVGYPKDVREVLLGEEGALKTLKAGGVLVDMTTSSPSLAKEISIEASKKGCLAVDAPVSGGDVGARNATLSIMIGGEKDVVEKLQPVFQAMGKNIKRMGDSGAGQHTKVVNQILIASTMIGMVEGLLYAQAAKLDLDDAIAAVGAGAAGSWSINNLGPRIVKGDLAPGFYVDHFVKDLEIALEQCKEMDLTLPGVELAKRCYEHLQKMGHGHSGTHSLILAFAEMNSKQFETKFPIKTEKS